MTNIHRDKASKYKASQRVSESSEGFSNFSGRKRENIKNKNNQRESGDRVEIAFTSFTKVLQILATADFIEVKVPQIYFHRTFTTFTKTARGGEQNANQPRAGKISLDWTGLGQL